MVTNLRVTVMVQTRDKDSTMGTRTSKLYYCLYDS
jgi:hypothetical protein